MKKNEMGGTCGTYGRQRGAYRYMMGRPEGKRLRRGRRREDNIEIDLQEVGLGFMDWINLFKDWDMWRALVNKEMNLLVS